MSKLELLPPKGKIETKTVLKKAAEAHRYLAELKGVAHSIPNQNILIDTLTLQEARESSAIENIISTFDDVYQSNSNSYISSAAKEVHAYSSALKVGFELVKKNGLLTSNHILKIQSTIENNKAGFRKLPGTKLFNESTGETVYTPPQDYDTIVDLMSNLQNYINNDGLTDVDPLIKMAVIHHQFESIHPFYDGNGRTGRIINILFLIKNDLLSLPILYLSRYIIKHKADYYRLLQEVRNTKDWEPWILFMLDAIAETSKSTIRMINGIALAMQQYKGLIRDKATKIYSQDLLNNLFRYPYTKIEYLMNDLSISRNTAIRYLEKLEKLDLITKKKVGRDNFYVNKSLLDILINPKY
ncbi:MAG: Fic family protein [Bacteroidota bacterium]|nr:Fic family protein [Bacteroidota bacterium]